MKEKAINMILENIQNLKVKYVAEDEKSDATMQQLQRAICLASETELKKFCDGKHKHEVPFEDGYLVVIF